MLTNELWEFSFESKTWQGMSRRFSKSIQRISRSYKLKIGVEKWRFFNVKIKSRQQRRYEGRYFRRNFEGQSDVHCPLEENDYRKHFTSLFYSEDDSH